jgi:hypothetical protein
MSKAEHAKNYILVAVCALLIGLNIAVFIFFPGLLHPIAIVLSNVITVLLTVLAFRPVSKLMDSELEAKQKELAARIEEQKALESKVSRLEIENQELTSQLDTREQTESIPTAINYTFKLEQMEFAKKGYVVKEDFLEKLDPERYRLPELNWWTVFIGESGEKKILYIHKFYYKVAIGIDFAKIKYSMDGSRLLFSGVKFTKLHDISSELETDHGDIERCEILQVDGDKTDIKHDKAFNGIKKTYCEEQEREVKESLEKEVGNLCNLYTDIFRDTMQKRYPQVGFVDSIEDSTMNWYILNGNTNAGVAEIASNMLMLTNVLGKTQSAGEISFPQA